MDDIDILTKQAMVHVVDLEQCALFVDSTPLKRSMTDAAGFLREAATALQAEHEARGKAEGERDEVRTCGSVENGELREWLAAVEARATAAEAQLASAREALAEIEMSLSFALSLEWETNVQASLDTTREALLSIPAPVVGPVLAFGSGSLVVEGGLYDGQHAVFVYPAKEPGTVNTSAAREVHPPDRLVSGEIVLTFPTEAQVDYVMDAFYNRERGSGFASSEPTPTPPQIGPSCGICGKENDNDALSDICQQCEAEAPWRDDLDE